MNYRNEKNLGLFGDVDIMARIAFSSIVFASVANTDIV